MLKNKINSPLHPNMKKNFTILSLVLITLFSLNVKAQDEHPQAKSYLGLIGGLSIPNGSFGQANYSNNTAGFAKKGGMLGLDAGIYLYKNFGIGIIFSYQDQGELSALDAASLANGYNTSYGKDETNVTTVDRYQNINLMVGPQYTFLYKSFALDLRASAGIIKSIATPSYGVVFDYSNNKATYLNQISSRGDTFAYGASIGFRYSLSDSWDIGLKGNYISSNGIKIENSGPFSTAGRWQTNLPISVIQTTLGISVKF